MRLYDELIPPLLDDPHGDFTPDYIERWAQIRRSGRICGRYESRVSGDLFEQFRRLRRAYETHVHVDMYGAPMPDSEYQQYAQDFVALAEQLRDFSERLGTKIR